MQRGRPTQSLIRQNIIEILYGLKQSYGYQICKIYNEVFSKVNQRSIYYHLRKGIMTREIVMKEITQEKGDFSWGRIVEKKYYELGPKALPSGNQALQVFLSKFKR